MSSWAADELRYTELGNKRLTKRIIRVVEKLAEKHQAGIPKAMAIWPETKAAFWLFASGLMKRRAFARRTSCAWRAGEGSIGNFGDSRPDGVGLHLPSVDARAGGVEPPSAVGEEGAHGVDGEFERVAVGYSAPEVVGAG
ncbi:MAG: transposase [Anaerolineales bacterium]|nr:transposase [Anaerolineales bacterium]